MAKVTDFSAPYRIDDGRRFHLDDVDPGETRGIKSKQRAATLLQDSLTMLTALQDKQFAQDRWGVLVIFQAMDAAGKDSTIKHVMSGVNPQSVHVTAFKAPSSEELDHDYLWRHVRQLPERGRIGIFNRSYYEEVLVVRVRKEILAGQKLPPSLVSKDIWRERFEDINAFERYLSRNGFVILKFFLHVSKEEQRKRFLERLERPEKNWKFALGDVKERALWGEYMHAYEDMIQHTSHPHAPWYVVPADRKWFARLVVSSAIIEAVASLKLDFPNIDAAKRKELEATRLALEAEGRAQK